MYLEKILFLENNSFENLSDSEEKQFLAKIMLKLNDISNDIKSQPEGRITLKESGSLFITGFSGELLKKVSERLNS